MTREKLVHMFGKRGATLIRASVMKVADKLGNLSIRLNKWLESNRSKTEWR
jgi:hypothetical protein